jgi:hypothetical protein
MNADFHARQHAIIAGEMSFNDRRQNDQTCPAAVCERGTELVLAAMASHTPANTPMTSAEAGSAFAPPTESIEDVKAAKKAKARAIINRGKAVHEHMLDVHCPRHGKDFLVEVSITSGIDGWSLNAVPNGCDGDDHGWTPDERLALADRIDVAYDAARVAGTIR